MPRPMIIDRTHRTVGWLAAFVLLAGCGRAGVPTAALERTARALETRSVDADLAHKHPAGGPGWYAVQLHCHSTYSDGKVSPRDLIQMAKAGGLDALTLSDHDCTTQWLDPDVVAERDLLMLHGQESEGVNSHNHIGLHGMTGITPITPGLPRDVTLADAVARHALIVINHPTNDEYPWDPLVFDRRANAVEVWNSWYWFPALKAPAANVPGHDYRTDQRAIDWWASLLDAGERVPAVGGADFHMKPQDPCSPCTLVFAQDRTEAAIDDAIRAGHTLVAHDPNCARVELTADPAGGTDFSAMVGDTVPASARFHFHVVGGKGRHVTWLRGSKAIATFKVTSNDWTQDASLPGGAGAPAVYARLDGFSLVGNTLESLTSAIYLQAPEST